MRDELKGANRVVWKCEENYDSPISGYNQQAHSKYREKLLGKDKDYERVDYCSQ